MSAILKPVIEFRPMRESDLSAVMAIETDIYEFPWTLGNFRDSLAAGYICFAYLQDAELIGYGVAMLAVDEAHLLNLSIARPRQGRGHGGVLLRRMCELCRSGGAKLMYLEVRPSNAAALRLYERHGFKRAGLRQDYYPTALGREDALIFNLAL